MRFFVPTIKAWLPPLSYVVLLLFCGVANGAPAAPLQRIATLRVPGKPLRAFDISFVNSDGIYALADRSNGGLDLFDAATEAFLGRATGFAGAHPAKRWYLSGPDGVVAVGQHEFWAGDGDSTVKVVDVRTKEVIATIPTGGHRLTDQLTYDPRDHLVVAVNNADDPPFVTFISARTRKVLGRVVLEEATSGAKQMVWDPASKLIYLALPSVDGHKARGAVAVIDPRARRLVRLLTVSRCMPAGLALEPGGKLLVGCSYRSVSKGFPARSFVMTNGGRIVARLRGVVGSDEIWSDPAARRYYLANLTHPGGPVLSVVDSRTNRLLRNLPTGPRAHSVAADARTGRVFMPIAAGQGPCPEGCIEVFGAAK